ncbi:MAG: hypothetical protein ACE5JH_01440 [Acidobacteriota bacterium]
MPAPARNRVRRGLAAAALGVLLALAPGPARACPRCFESSDSGVLRAYYGTAVLLSALPLGIMGMLLYAIRRTTRRRGRAGARPPEDESARIPG